MWRTQVNSDGTRSGRFFLSIQEVVRIGSGEAITYFDEVEMFDESFCISNYFTEILEKSSTTCQSEPWKLNLAEEN